MKTLVDLKSYCLQHAGTKEDYPFGPEPLVMKVGGKMFAILSESRDTSDSESATETSISLKCEPHMAELFRMQYESVKPGYHLNKKHWNTITLDGSVPASELQEMIDHSYDLVVRSLTKKQREEMW